MKNSIYSPTIEINPYKKCLVIKACRDDDFLKIYPQLKEKIGNADTTLFLNRESKISTRDKQVFFDGNISWKSIYQLNDEEEKYDALFCFIKESDSIRHLNIFWFIRKLVNDEAVDHENCYVVDSYSSIIRDYLSNWNIVYFNEAYSIKDQIIYSPFEEKKDLLQNSELLNRHAGKRCFLVGNGPSLKQQNILPLKDEITITMNSFYLHKDVKVIMPKYYMFTYMVFDIEKPYIEMMNQQENALKNTTLIYSYGKYGFFNARELIESHGYFKNNNLYYVRFAGRYSNDYEIEIDLTKSIPNMRNSAIACLAVAIYMGFKEIYLLGCDSDMIHHYPKNYNHFYTKDAIDKYEKFSEGDHFAYTEILNFTNYNWIAFWSLKKYAEKRGQKIYNATPNSKLDMFERIKYEDMI